jgi:hypothetical protein
MICNSKFGKKDISIWALTKMDTGKTAAVKLQMEINFGQEKTRHLE